MSKYLKVGELQIFGCSGGGRCFIFGGEGWGGGGGGGEREVGEEGEGVGRGR